MLNGIRVKEHNLVWCWHSNPKSPGSRSVYCGAKSPIRPELCHKLWCLLFNCQTFWCLWHNYHKFWCLQLNCHKLWCLLLNCRKLWCYSIFITFGVCFSIVIIFLCLLLNCHKFWCLLLNSSFQPQFGVISDYIIYHEGVKCWSQLGYFTVSKHFLAHISGYFCVRMALMRNLYIMWNISFWIHHLSLSGTRWGLSSWPGFLIISTKMSHKLHKSWHAQVTPLCKTHQARWG